jgi:hypothetical protein
MESVFWREALDEFKRNFGGKKIRRIRTRIEIFIFFECFEPSRVFSSPIPGRFRGRGGTVKEIE